MDYKEFKRKVEAGKSVGLSDSELSKIFPKYSKYTTLKKLGLPENQIESLMSDILKSSNTQLQQFPKVIKKTWVSPSLDDYFYNLQHDLSFNFDQLYETLIPISGIIQIALENPSETKTILNKLTNILDGDATDSPIFLR